MTFKSATPPLCRYCGKAIPKRTGHAYFGERSEDRNPHWRRLTEKPATREEAQALFNVKIVSVRWSHDRTYIASARTWDGESYIDEFFHIDECAVRFGMICAAAGKATETYSKALAKQKGGK